MKFGSAAIAVNSSLSSNFVTRGIDTSQMWAFSVQANYAGVTSAVAAGLGTMKLQISNDIVPAVGNVSSGDQSQYVQNWCDYTGTLASTTAAAGSSSFFWIISNPGFKWFRFAYTNSSGHGFVSVNMFNKGA